MIKLDDYTLRKSLGKTSLAELYLTTKQNDPKKYLTKVYSRENIDNSDIKKHLGNEMIILQYLNHPNIVKFQEVKKTKKHYYLIYEYCNGGDLSQALENYIKKYGKPFPEEIVQYLMRQIIDAFKYIHEKKVIHRCISLDNILLNYENEEDANNLNLMKAKIKIVDFVFACRIKNGLKDSLQYAFLGNTKNTDPLILKNLRPAFKKTRELGYNEKADIWSLGSICYEMLIGKPVFDAEEMIEFLLQIKQGIYSVPTHLSHEVISFINGMLQYNADKRLTASQLSRHAFLKKDINQFKKIDLEKVSDKVNENKLDINAVKNSTIWSIFNKEDETLLSSILGNEYVKPMDKKEELELSKKDLKESSVKIPSKGIPDNPKDENITGMSKEDLDEIDPINNGAINPFIGDTIDI